MKKFIFQCLLFFIIPSLLAKEFTFSIHHFLGPTSITHSEFLVPWSKKVEKESKGKIKFEIFPSMSLGGKPNELYKQVRDGVVDIVWTLPGYTPGVFPRVEVFELPGIHLGSALATNLAIQDTQHLIEDDFSKVKIILIHTHSGNALHLVNKNITSINDLKGLKIRTPSRTGAWVIESWQAEPVGMSVPTLPQALAKKTIDGALIPFEIAIPLRISELTDYSVELINGQRFGTSIFIFVMNKRAYNLLPPDLQKVIDANSGLSWAKFTGRLWDNIEITGKKIARDNGVKVTTLSKSASEIFNKNNKIVIDRWLANTKGKFASKKILQSAKSAIVKHTN